MKHASPFTIAIAIAALATACTGRTSSVNMSEERTRGALKANESQRLALIGCVRPAPNNGEGKYILAQVVTPTAETQPQSIPRGSWVRLAGPDMKSYLGKQVEVSGDMVDAGLNSIGAVGTSGSAQEKQWPRAAEANGDAPRLAVETVKVRDGNCSEERHEPSTR